MENQSLRISVGEFIALTNQILEGAYPSVEVEGEVASFKVNQGKYVFFDLKDTEGTVGCFMMVFALRIPIEDGMKVVVRATPKLTKWGKFSLTVQQVRPVGEGNLKKSFELLRAKLEKEGLFGEDRKRELPALPNRIAVISSTQAAGYGDFMKILDARWRGVAVDVAHVQVQGDGAADQIIRALQYFNEQAEPADVLVILRGGGSADDLATFNDEQLVRAVASSRIPVLTGIGHEVDISLCDLAADQRASTPSNAAEMVVPERAVFVRALKTTLLNITSRIEQNVDTMQRQIAALLTSALTASEHKVALYEHQLANLRNVLNALDPRQVLERGYAIVRGDLRIGRQIEIELYRKYIQAEVRHVSKK